ncbi:MAG: 4Fe-4S binding protein [Termitinemataceae bacterium]|nr:MAG: 4Fe-4S binding protein [Termitinemataceae bacterium]
MAQKPLKRKAPAIIRFLIALSVLALFVYAYISLSLGSNGILTMLVNAQFSPSLYGTGLALPIIAIAIAATTLIFGRLYCSVLCPLGTAQEIFWRIGRLLRGGKSPPRSSPEYGSSATPFTGGAAPRNAPRLFRSGYHAPPKVRYLSALLVAAGVIFSIAPLMILIDPISIFGRGMGTLRTLLYQGGGSTLFMLYLAIPLLLILIAAVLRGRAFCEWCPVGVTLGLFSSAALFRIKLGEKCVSCGQCEKKCPASCIDSKAKRIDSERCVLCFSCTAACPSGSAVYGARGKALISEAPISEGRRIFLKKAGSFSLACGAAYLVSPLLRLPSQSVDKALANLSTEETLPILPPGAKNLLHYTRHCISCHACVASCPANIITAKDDPHPSLDYNGDASAACQFSCTECGRVCPTGAIGKLSVEEKHKMRIALSTLYFDRCVVKTKGESCGACAEVCPTGALTMVAYSEAGIAFLTRPIYDEKYCIGCGACLASCPAEPRAFTIEAVPQQSLTVGSRPLEEAGDELNVDMDNSGDFPF